MTPAARECVTVQCLIFCRPRGDANHRSVGASCSGSEAGEKDKSRLQCSQTHRIWCLGWHKLPRATSCQLLVLRRGATTTSVSLVLPPSSRLRHAVGAGPHRPCRRGYDTKQPREAYNTSYNLPQTADECALAPCMSARFHTVASCVHCFPFTLYAVASSTTQYQ